MDKSAKSRGLEVPRGGFGRREPVGDRRLALHASNSNFASPNIGGGEDDASTPASEDTRNGALQARIVFLVKNFKPRFN